MLAAHSTIAWTVYTLVTFHAGTITKVSLEGTRDAIATSQVVGPRLIGMSSFPV